MYIVPNSKVYILSGIPLGKNYQHTIYLTTLTRSMRIFVSTSKRRLRACRISVKTWVDACGVFSRRIV